MSGEKRTGILTLSYCTYYRGSHDAFAFIPPVDPILIQTLKHKQNTWGGENVVLEAMKYGAWMVSNPCAEIKPIHSHCSAYRPNPGTRIHVPNTGNRRNKTSWFQWPTQLKDLIEDDF